MSDIKDRRIAELEGLVQGLRSAFQSVKIEAENFLIHGWEYEKQNSKIIGICEGAIAASKHFRRGRPDRISEYEGERE